MRGFVKVIRTVLILVVAAIGLGAQEKKDYLLMSYTTSAAA